MNVKTSIKIWPRAGSQIAPDFIVRSGPISKLVDKQSIDDFRQKGVTVLRGAFTDWVNVLRDGLVSSPPFPNLTLKSGDPLTGDTFPFLLHA